MRHKHADLIHAWADGAKIQYFSGRWFYDPQPLWLENTKYRVKPRPKPKPEMEKNNG
jgi:hypothetical protein